jgi:4-carboxymuconolactone decarboxylase
MEKAYEMTIKQTAGRKNLGEFAPDFAHYNDDVLFGEVWNDETLSPHDRSMITIAAIIAMGATEQLDAHLNIGKGNGITEKEIATEITHLSFYVGWPKAWSAFNRAKHIWNRDGSDVEDKEV